MEVVTLQVGHPKRVWICQRFEADARGNKTSHCMHSSVLNTANFSKHESSCSFEQRYREKSLTLTIRGPALKGVNIVGLATNLFRRLGSIHRSGSKLSASSPHNAGLRWIKRGRKSMIVVGGIYSGWFEVLGYVASDWGKTHGVERHSRTFRGTGGNKRRVSFITAFTKQKKKEE